MIWIYLSEYKFDFSKKKCDYFKKFLYYNDINIPTRIIFSYNFKNYIYRIKEF